MPEGTITNKKNITEYLARQIIGGQLKYNEIIPNEIDFAAKFGVSRTMIRDVLKNLEMKGLIERKTNVGTRVRNIQSWNLLDEEVLNWSAGLLTQNRFLLSLLELRLIVEPQAAALAAVRANDSDLQLISENFAHMWNSGMPGNEVTLNTEADIAFHKAIIKASGNLFISQIGGAIQAALHHTIYLSNKANIDHKKSLDCHRRVLTAIENRNSEGAYAGMCCVLQNTIADIGLQSTGVILSDFSGM
ncbi:MAG: FCD domain-containing protein [Deltaproteobacteria bacterium]|nr:FCD domain-containing protein [Deltaproteobacteria bacterium]